MEDVFRFRREAAIVSQLKHPHLVRIYEVGQDGGLNFLAMELIEGQGLDEILSAAGKETVGVDFALEVVTQAAATLGYVHRTGVVHRDIKPANILLLARPEPASEPAHAPAGKPPRPFLKLVDFGLSRVIDLGRIKEKQVVTGTFSYMSPEQAGILSHPVDERSDLYSLGMVFYEMLTGRRPFEGPDVNSIIYQQVAREPQAPTRIRRGIPPVIEKIVLKLICKDPADRYQSTQGLLEDLQRVAAGESPGILDRAAHRPRLNFRTRLIGRAGHTDKLQRLYQQAAGGSGGLCLISGEAGQGKSRLAEEFRVFVLKNTGTFISGKCFFQENKVPYQPFAEALNDYLRQVERMGSDERNRRLLHMRDSIREQAEIICRLVPEIQEVFGEVPSLAPLEPEKEIQRFALTSARFFLRLGEIGKPVVLLLDDLQWADEGSLGLLEAIAEEIAGAPLLILGTFRDSEIGPHHSVRRIIQLARDKKLPLETVALEPLEKVDTRELVAQVLGEKIPPVEEIGRYVHSKSRGNPLYSLELVNQLAAAEVLYFYRGTWHFDPGRLDRVAVPDTMVEVIRQRIHRLDRDHLQVLSMAAVIGYRFSLDILYRLADYPRERVIQWIDEAIALQLLDASPLRGELVFCHDQVHEALYTRLGIEHRRQLHARIAGLLEQTPEEKRNEKLFDLAHHFHAAGQADKCLRYALPAADEARRRYANEEAIRYYRMALDLLGETGRRGDPDWIRAKEGLMQIYATIGSHDAAIELGRELLAVQADVLGRVRMHRAIGLNYFKKSDYPNAEKSLLQGLHLLGRRLPQKKWWVLLQSAREFSSHLLRSPLAAKHRGRPARRLTDRDREIACLYEALHQLYMFDDYIKFFCVTLKLMNFGQTRLGKSRELAAALSGYAFVCTGMGRFEHAIQYHKLAMDMYADLGDAAGVALATRNTGYAYLAKGDFENAERILLEARDRINTVGDLYELIHVLNGLQLTYYNWGRIDRRDEVVNTLLEVSRRIENHFGITTALSSFGGSCLVRGDLPAAEKWLQEALQVGGQNRQWVPCCVAHSVYSLLQLEKEDFEAALHHADSAYHILEKHHLLKPVVALAFICRTDAHLAHLKHRTNSMDLRQRRKQIRKIKVMVREMTTNTMRWPLFRGLALRVKAQFADLAGRPSKAQRLFEAALQQLAGIDRRFELAKTHAQYGDFLENGGRHAAAAEQWQQAFNMFSQAGALVWQRRMAEHLGVPEEAPPKPAEMTESRRLASLLQASRDITSILDIEGLLETLLAKAMEVTGAQRGFLFIAHEHTEKLELKISKAVETNHTVAFQFSSGIVERVYRSAQPLIIADAGRDENLDAYRSVADYELKSVLCVPLRHYQRVLGGCYLDNPLTGGVFGDDDARLLEAFMAQSAICLENARAYEKIRALNRELKKEGDLIKKEIRQLKNIVRFNSAHIKSYGDIQLVTQDERLLQIIDKSSRFAQTTANVLITGDSGVGKEIFAHLIHMNSERQDKPFVKINCAAIPEALFESEFFGYEKGAFSGAVKTKKSKFELAHGGTLFLDEVAEFPLAQQAKLLRALEDGEITRVGGSRPLKVNVKVICATNKNLAQLVRDGRFRQDLFFRLNVLHLQIPALLERRDDIPVLASYFLARIANQEGGREKYFDDGALIFLKNLDLPGNVRELRNLIHRVYLSTEKDVVTREDIENCRLQKDGHPSVVFEGSGEALYRPAAADGGASDALAAFFQQTQPFREVKTLFETRYLAAQLKKHNYNVSQTAKSLGLQPSALFRKLKSLDIQVKKTVR